MTDPESPGAVETAEARLVSALRELAKLSPLFGRSFANTALSDVPVSMPHVTFPTTVVAEWNVHYETLRLFACAVTGSDDPTPNDIHDHLRRQAFERSRRDAAVRREALAPFAWAIAEAFRCEKDIEIRVGSLTTVVTAADVRLALATGDSDVR